MNFKLFAARLRAVALCESTSFTEIVRLSGLSPAHDFRFADLSCADLRHQDLRAFDLSHANLAGAAIQGALFNRSVSRKQLATARSGVPVVVIPIGERILGMAEKIASHLGENVLIPQSVTDALRQLTHDPERRLKRRGIYLGDNTDLVRKRLSRHFKDLILTFRKSGACFLIFEPDNDLDFDTLNVILGYLHRDNVNAVVFILPHLMESGESLSQIVTARLRTLSPRELVNLSNTGTGRRVNLYEKPPQLLSRLERTREKLLGFVWAVAHAKLLFSVPARRELARGVREGVILIDGARRGRESLPAALARDFRNGLASEYTIPDRVHLFVAESLLSPSDVELVRSQLSGNHRSTFCLSVFTRQRNSEAEYYIVAGAADNSIWNSIGLTVNE